MAADLEMVKLLVEQGADIQARDYRGDVMPLHDAARLGSSDIIDYLLSQGADINSRDHYGFSALSYALRKGHVAPARHLIERGIDFKLTNDDTGLLSSSTREGYVGVFQIPLERGLSVDSIGKDGKTPLVVAAKAGQCDMVAFLLDQGAKINGVYKEREADG